MNDLPDPIDFGDKPAATDDPFSVASGQLHPESGALPFSRGAGDRLSAVTTMLDFYADALALCPKASGATLDWLNASIAEAQAEQAALTEIVDMLAAAKQLDDEAKADDAAAATAAVAVVP